MITLLSYPAATAGGGKSKQDRRNWASYPSRSLTRKTTARPATSPGNKSLTRLNLHREYGITEIRATLGPLPLCVLRWLCSARSPQCSARPIRPRLARSTSTASPHVSLPPIR